ncbi:hypothetical protein HDU76_013162 [Blyttiomyces sp. JEL0837]|nr:hypothetical protein HDU76_013162 [Blyttiomyces sp. JEL0837]
MPRRTSILGRISRSMASAVFGIFKATPSPVTAAHDQPITMPPFTTTPSTSIMLRQVSRKFKAAHQHFTITFTKQNLFVFVEHGRKRKLDRWKLLMSLDWDNLGCEYVAALIYLENGINESIMRGFLSCGKDTPLPLSKAVRASSRGAKLFYGFQLICKELISRCNDWNSSVKLILAMGDYVAVVGFYSIDMESFKAKRPRRSKQMAITAARLGHFNLSVWLIGSISGNSGIDINILKDIFMEACTQGDVT